MSLLDTNSQHTTTENFYILQGPFRLNMNNGSSCSNILSDLLQSNNILDFEEKNISYYFYGLRVRNKDLLLLLPITLSRVQHLHQ